MGKRPLLSKRKTIMLRRAPPDPHPPRSVARSGKWVHLDSNQGPAGYEPDALTAELWTRGSAPFRATRQYTIHGLPRRADAPPGRKSPRFGPGSGPARPRA